MDSIYKFVKKTSHYESIVTKRRKDYLSKWTAEILSGITCDAFMNILS